MQKITPYLWFDHQAEEAVHFYVSLFKHSNILNISRYGGSGSEVSGMEKGSVMSVSFELEGQTFLALNGGPLFTFSPAISFLVNCETQQEIDNLCDKFSQGGNIGKCGWLTDRYGLSWQLVPTVLGKLLNDPDPKKSERVMKAMLSMDKLDIKQLQQAYEQAT